MTGPDDFWICSACTWVNKRTESSCKACGKNAPPGAIATAPSPIAAPAYAYQPPVTASAPPAAYAYPPPASASAPPAAYAYQPSDVAASAPDVPAELWVCSKCEWVNKNTASSCKACGLNAPPGTVVVAPASTPAATPAPVIASTPITAPMPGTTQGYGYTYTPVQVPVVAPPRPSVQPAAPQAYGAPSSTSDNTVQPPKQPVQVQNQTDDFVSGFANHGKKSNAPRTARPSTNTYATMPVAVPTAPPAVRPPEKQIFKIKEKFYGFGDNFTIKDSSDRSVYKVKGKVFSWGDKLSFQDTSGRELAFISQEMLSFQPQYAIHRNGAVFAKVVKEWTWMSKRFTLDVPGPNDYTIDGSFWEHDFTFMRKGRPVARVNKRYFAFSDSYGVEINAGEDVVSILCACIVIDQVLHDD